MTERDEQYNLDEVVHNLMDLHHEEGIAYLRTLPEDVRRKTTRRLLHEAFEGIREFEKGFYEQHGISAREHFDVEHPSDCDGPFE